MQPQLLLQCSALTLENYCYNPLLGQVMPALMM
jgi:hypothetical protein